MSSDFEEIFGVGFNAEEEAARAAEEYAPVPPGWYQAVIEPPTDGKPMVRDTKACGKMLKVVFRITGPASAGRKVFHNINLVVKALSADKEANARTAERIGRRELARLCVAAGRPLAKDSAELVDAALEIKVAVGRNRDGEPDNEVKDVRRIGTQQIPSGGVQPIPATQTAGGQQQGGGRLPWMM